MTIVENGAEAGGSGGLRHLSMQELGYGEHAGDLSEWDVRRAQNPGWHVEDSPWKAQQIFRMIQKHNLQPETVAEVGCGAGEVLHSLEEQMSGVRAFHGFDTASDAIEMARKKENDRLHFHLEDLLSTDHYFDLLLVIDVVEHVPNYLEFLERCREKAHYKIYHIPLEIHVSSVLRGRVASARKSVGHIHYFSAESALASLEDTGHRVIDYGFTPGAVALAAMHPSLKRSVANFGRRLVSMVSEPISSRLFGGSSLLALTQ